MNTIFIHPTLNLTFRIVVLTIDLDDNTRNIWMCKLTMMHVVCVCVCACIHANQSVQFARECVELELIASDSNAAASLTQNMVESVTEGERRCCLLVQE